MDCPACRQPLIVAERSGIELDCCPGCRGIWFDATELDLLIERLGLPQVPRGDSRFALAESKERPRSCPRCDRALEKDAVVARAHRERLSQGQLDHWREHQPAVLPSSNLSTGLGQIRGARAQPLLAVMRRAQKDLTMRVIHVVGANGRIS